MSKEEFRSQLPSPKGSPFKTKNFNKFFFGILIATLVLVALILAYFLLGFGKHEPVQPASSTRLMEPQSQRNVQVRLC